MKLWTLMENTACREDCTCEHGLSLYIETGAHRILFDTGQTGAFADNAATLGIDLQAVDLCILSHGHYDHGGGLIRFLALNDHAPVYLSRHAFGQHYNGTAKYIGLDPALASSDRLVFADDQLVLDETLSLHSSCALPTPYPADPFGLTVLREGVFIPEDFRHEQYLLIREGQRRILISGCSHRGILNIVDHFRPDVLVGGFHMMKLDPTGNGAQTLEAAAQTLLTFSTTYYTGHCTGAEQFSFLRERMGNRLQALSAGSYHEI